MLYILSGPTSSLTVAAQRMMQRCFEKLAEKEEQFMKLEKQINPLLDDNDQVLFLSTSNKIYYSTTILIFATLFFVSENIIRKQVCLRS